MTIRQNSVRCSCIGRSKEIECWQSARDQDPSHALLGSASTYCKTVPHWLILQECFWSNAGESGCKSVSMSLYDCISVIAINSTPLVVRRAGKEIWSLRSIIRVRATTLLEPRWDRSNPPTGIFTHKSSRNSSADRPVSRRIL